VISIFILSHKKTSQLPKLHRRRYLEIDWFDFQISYDDYLMQLLQMYEVIISRPNFLTTFLSRVTNKPLLPF